MLAMHLLQRRVEAFKFPSVPHPLMRPWHAETCDVASLYINMSTYNMSIYIAIYIMYVYINMSMYI